MEILKAINKLLNPFAPPRNYPINHPTITLFTDDYSYLLFSNFRLALWLSAETLFHWESRNNRRDLTQAPTTAHIYPPTSIHVCPFGLLSLLCMNSLGSQQTWTLQHLNSSGPFSLTPWALLPPSANFPTAFSISPSLLDPSHQHINRLLFIPLKKKSKQANKALNPTPSF